MTSSRKIIVLIPPLLIGVTILITLFVVRHNQNIQGSNQPPVVIESATTTEGFEVTKPLPPTTSPDQSDEPVISPGEGVACTMDAKMCPDGSYVGRVAPNCAFAPCPNEDNETQKEIVCSPESRMAEVCMEIYAPVCGVKQVQCVTEPCEPIPTDYSNSCFACMDSQVESYTEGVCLPLSS